MKNLKTIFLIALSLVVVPAFGQTILTNTTLSSAVTSSSTRTFILASATGVSAPSASDNTKATFLYVDRELVSVTGVNGTSITVVRGSGGTTAAPHASSAVVFVIPAYQATWIGQPPPQGSCTRSNEIILPRIYPTQGVFSDCLGGQWVSSKGPGQTTYPQPNGLRFPDPGATALTALETAGTAPSANTEIYCSEIDLANSQIITGLGNLNGTTVGTDKHWVILYDSSGNVLANSAAAGATTSGASTYQKFAFTSKYYAVAPARYFACVGSNGTTDTIRHAITAVNDNILGGTVTAQVFGTAASITVPSSFTTAKAPYFLVY